MPFEADICLQIGRHKFNKTLCAWISKNDPHLTDVLGLFANPNLITRGTHSGANPQSRIVTGE